MDFGNLAAWTTAVATVVLAVGALLEGFIYLRSSKKRNTLDKINQLQTDPTLYGITVLIAEKALVKNEDGDIYDFSKLEKKDRIHVLKLLATYESMALSISEKITEEPLMKKEFKDYVFQLVEIFLPLEGNAAKAKLFTEEEAKDYFPSLISLYQKWKSENSGKSL